jgi:hypothetical protein
MTNRTFGARPLGLTATAALGFGLVAAAPALASPAAASPSASASVANDTLTITGTNGNDVIAVRLAAGEPNTLLVDFGDDGTAEGTFDRTTFSRISVFLRAGDDEFRDDDVNGAFMDEAVSVYGGSGDDKLIGGSETETFWGGAGNDTILAGAGNDLIFGGGGNDFVDGGIGTDTAHLGGGQDAFQWDPGEGSDVIDGGGGTDTLLFNGSNGNEIMSLSANGKAAVFLRNLGNIRMDMDGVERLDLHALGGTDAITINDMKGTDFRQADVDLAAPGGGGDNGADVVTVNGTDKADRMSVEAQGAVVDVDGLRTETSIAGSEPALDHLQVSTLDGNDRVDVDPAVSTLIGVAVDLGPGQS